MQDRWTLLDTENRVYHEAVSRHGDSFSPALAGREGASDLGFRWTRLSGGLCDGVDLLEVDNGPWTVYVLPTRGMSVWRIQGEMSLGWRSPVRGPVNPAFVPLMDPGGLGWLEGFDELLVRCGLESNGPPLFDEQGRLAAPLHGRIGNRPAHFVGVRFDAETDEIVIDGLVSETRFLIHDLVLHVEYRLPIGERRMRVRDRVANRSGRPAEMQMLYHINVGSPLLAEGARLHVPTVQAAPRDSRAAENAQGWAAYGGPDAGYAEQVYFFDLASDAESMTEALLESPGGERGFGLAWDREELPCFAQWKNTASLDEGYVTGLEPGTNYPNPKPYERDRGRVRKLAPGESVAFELELREYVNREEVDEAAARILDLTPGDPLIHAEPQRDWSI